MKKIILSISFLLSIGYSFAQKTYDTQNWYYQNFEKTGVYGVGSDDAIEFLKSKGIKPQTITIAVLDSGVEIDHEDLKNNIWVNKNEIKANGKDDDKNGYIDDINGWDFIGGKDGTDVDIDTYEMLRITVEGKTVFEGNEANQKKFPAKYEEYLLAKKGVEEKKKEFQTNLDNYRQYQIAIPMIFGELKNYTGKNKLTPEYLNTLKIDNQMLAQIVPELAKTGETADYTADEYIVKMKKDLDEGVKHFQEGLQFQLNDEYDPRNIVGDNYANKKEKFYGNNEVEGPDATHGTHVSGIIAAQRNNGIGMDGIAGDVAKIMVVRTVPNGDERDKDIANAIRYAADNGAKIMNMSFGKDYSPDKEIVWEAIKYADSKGILMFHAAGNDNKNIYLENSFPTNFKDGKSFTKNWITIGASTRYNDKLRADFSNYANERVDLFAPGLEIYSTVPNNKYESTQGTSMASPAAAGCAALLWAYFPTFTSQQIKDILFKTVNKSDAIVGVGEQDEKGEYATKVKFSDLSATGGVIDVYKAVKLAYEIYQPQKNTSKPTKKSTKKKK